MESNSGSGSDEIMLTLVNADTGESESIPFPTSTSLSQVVELCQAIFNVASIELRKEGRPISNHHLSLAEAGLANGDVLAVQSKGRPPMPHAGSSAAAAAASGGLDFSNLLAAAAAGASSSSSVPPGVRGSSTGTGGAGGGGLDFGNLLSMSNAGANPPPPVYYKGMNLQEATGYNPHPETFIDLCISKEHLQKELNYYNPRLAAKLRGKDRVAMVQVWREELVKGGIQGALQASSKLLKERQMQDRRLTYPNDPEVVEYYASIERKKKVQQQYEQMMQEYPEALGRVLMLYIGCKINGHDIQAFCDSGAQSTIMSKKKATECELIDYVDTRFEGTAVGVGTGKILGRIHIVQLQVGSYFLPCSITVMDDPPPGAAEMPFLLGLDMMKRHQCVVDLGKGVLKWKLDDDYLEAPFLHEKDLDESQGGTKGFDASAANQKVMEMHEKEDGEDMSD